jgi:hypothetical protein
MKVNRGNITWGVIALPLKWNLISRFKKGGEHKKRWRMHRSWGNKDVKTVRKRKLLGLANSLFPLCVGDIALWQFQTCCIDHSIPFFWQRHRMLWMGRPLSSSTLMLTTSIGLRLQDRTSFDTSGDDILLDGSNKMGTRSHRWSHNDMALMWIDPCRVLARNQWYTSTNRAKWL